MSMEPPQKLRPCKRVKHVKKYATTTTKSIAKSTTGLTVISTNLVEQQHPSRQWSLRIFSKIYTSVDRHMRRLLTNSSVSSVLDSLPTDSSKASVRCVTSPMPRVTSAMAVENWLMPPSLLIHNVQAAERPPRSASLNTSLSTYQRSNLNLKSGLRSNPPTGHQTQSASQTQCLRADSKVDALRAT